MNSDKNRFLCLIVLTVIAVTGVAQESPDKLWATVSPAESRQFRANAGVALQADGNEMRFMPDSYRLFSLDRNILTRLAEKAVDETVMRAAGLGEAKISLPMPDGTFRQFELIEASVMSPALQAKYPGIRSYRGQCLDDQRITMRLDVSPSGLRAQILAPEGRILVNPVSEGTQHMSFSQGRMRGANAAPPRCLIETDDQNRARGGAAANRRATNARLSSGTQLRTYRIAVACTGEYAAYHGGTEIAAMTAINNTINRVTGVYEQEVAIRFELVDDNDQLIFTDPDTDPFNNSNANVLVNQSQTEIDRLIGDNDYDIGHTFSTGAGGYAPGPVGVTGQKARGVTGQSRPIGDPFDIDFVAHEIGHQLDGDHTFNGSGCNPSARFGPTAVEPGSGSTILAYAGICGADDLQVNSHAYFHSVTLDQITRYSTLGIPSVGTTHATGNNAPTVDAGAEFTIPKQTPFKLTAVGSDADNDSLRYCWEQIDTGPRAAASAPDDGRIPLFRSFPPNTERTRVFPQWSDILSSSQSAGEQLPSLTRTMDFQVTVRDNRSGGGGIGSDTTEVTVDDRAGPFRITSPSSTSVSSPLVEVKWDVAKTNQSPINCESVNILLSTDGGQSFTITLESETPNDGSQLVALPPIARNNLRLLVESVDNIFFAVNASTFAVEPANPFVFIVRHAEKQSGTDPDLTTNGKARAIELAHLMSGLGITQVYSTDTLRTRNTARPTAVATANDVEIYLDENIDSLVGKIQTADAGSRILVVGHSNTLAPIATAMGVTQTISVGNEFDNLFSVGLRDAAPAFAPFKYHARQQILSPAPSPIGLAQAIASESPVRNMRTSVALDEHDKQIRSSTNARSTQTDSAARTRAMLSTARRNVPQDRFLKSDLPAVFPAQNWTAAEAVEFYSLRQGSPIMRRDFFNILEQPDNTGLFRDSDYLSVFGFLPRRPHEGNIEGYPVGFTGDRAIEITCAACHTSKLTFADKEYWIDGSQAMTDVDSWLGELVRAIRLTVDDAPDLSAFTSNEQIRLDQNTKFGRFVRKLTGGTNSSVSQATVILELLKKELDRRQRYNDFNDFGKRLATEPERAAAKKHTPYGFGRLDALGAILNQACAEHLNAPDNARIADAPVNYPAIWDAPQHVHVQWNGSVDNTGQFGPLGRNAGQVVGVFGLVETENTAFGGYDSSINFDALERAEELITKLWSPEWPSEFGLNKTKANAGKAVYASNCIQCHAIIDRDDARRRANDVLVPIHQNHGGAKLMTDERTAKNWQNRTAEVGRLAGRLKSLPFQGSFPNNPQASVPARDVLSHIVFKSITRSFVPWRDELTIDDQHAARAMAFSRQSESETLMRYKARPLNGVWSTSPYLHNGSVLDIVELLKPPADRKKTFQVGTTKFDPKTLGCKDEGPFQFDTAHPGNSNQGHAYGTALTDDQKMQLIEYLKTL